MSSQQPLTQGGHLAFGDSDDDDALFNEEMCALLGSTVATLRSGNGAPATDVRPPVQPGPVQAPQQVNLQHNVPQSASQLAAPQALSRTLPPQQQPVGLKWNAAGSLARAAQQGRQQTQQMDSHNDLGHQRHQWNAQQAGYRPPGIQPHHLQQQQQNQPPRVQTTPATSFQSYHQSNSHQPQHSAQMAELQRQVEQYRQQLMFAQQELNEVRRARQGAATRDMGHQYDGQGIGVHRRVDQTKGIVNDVDANNANTESPSANKRPHPEGQRALSTPPSASVSTYATTKDTLVSIVPRFIGQKATGIGGHVGGALGHGGYADRHAVPLTYRLDRLERDIACLKQYRIKRAELFSILDEQHDMPGSVLVNLEAMLSFGMCVPGARVDSGVSETQSSSRKPNVKDISTMLLSVMAYVLGTDADMVLGKMEELGMTRSTEGGAHPVLSEHNTNATNNTATMAGVFPTEVGCTTAGTMAATAARTGDRVGGARALRGKPGLHDLPIERDAQRCVGSFVKFVGSFFTILNEFAADSTLLASMIDDLAEVDADVDGNTTEGDNISDVMKPSRKTMARNIVRTMDVLSRLDASTASFTFAQSIGSSMSSGCSPSSLLSSASVDSSACSYAMESVAKFVHSLARLRSDADKSILMPILKSKQLEIALLAYPGASRDEWIKFVMVMLEDNQTLAFMELEASKELNVTPSKRAVSAAQFSTPNKSHGGIRGVTRPRRHSMLNKRLGIEADTRGDEHHRLPGDPLWASRLTQTINLCMSIDEIRVRPVSGGARVTPNPSGSPASSTMMQWATVRLCLSFFASLVERSANALLQSVVDFKHLERYSSGDQESETLMHHIVRIAHVALGEGNLLHPRTCSETKLDQQRAYLRERRIVHESLVLLQALLRNISGAARCLALEDSNGALCMLEKVAIGYPLSTTSDLLRSDGRLALWVDTLDAAHGRTPRSLVSIAKGIKAMLLKELT